MDIITLLWDNRLIIVLVIMIAMTVNKSMRLFK